MKRSIGLIGFALLLAVSGFAQPATDWYLGKPIKDITFEGLARVDKNELDTAVKSYKGQTFTESLWMDLQAAIYALDYFEEISPIALPGDADYGSVIVKFTVKEKPWIETVRVDGCRGLRPSEILETALLKSGDIYNQAKARVDEQAIRKLYIEKGYADAKVSSSTESGKAENSLVLVFKVSEGSQVSIKEIRFEGNTSISASSLKGDLGLKEQGLFQPGLFQEQKLEADKTKVENIYQSRGYVDARVADVLREYKKDEGAQKTRMIITFVISEGQQYTFGGLTFSGNRIFSNDKLSSLVRSKTGAVLNYPVFLQDKQRIEDLYYENGYIFNRIDLKEKRDAENHVIAYSLEIVERDRAHIESIILKGNKKTKDSVITRELPFEVGDIFSKTKVVTGLRSLYNLQYFSAISPEMIPGSADNLMDLVLTVEEQSAADIQFGMTLSGIGSSTSTFPLSGLIKWSDRNFMGNGQTLSAGLTISPTDQEITFGFSDPWLLGKRITGSLELGFVHKTVDALQDTSGPVFSYDDNAAVPDPYTSWAEYKAAGYDVPDDYYMEYEYWNIYLTTSLGYRYVLPLGVVGLSGGIKFGITNHDYDTSLYRPYDEDLAKYAGEWIFGNSLIFKAYLNALDLWYDPGKGFYASQKFTWAGLFSFEKDQFLRTDTKLEGYLTLFDIPVSDSWSLKWVLGAHTGLSMLLPKPGVDFYAMDDSKLYIDGYFIGRGWTELDDDEFKGTALWENWLELRMPIVKNFLSLDGFLDAVTVKTENGLLKIENGDGTIDTNKDSLFDLGLSNMAFSTGVGFRFTISQFPFRFYFAKRFYMDEDTGSFEWASSGMDFVISISQTLN
jgi:outer membrane protein insertion porin family